ncbi:MAG: hypothetical protein ACR2HP_02465 [Ilumatobacteraceae bacterium]
MVYEQGELGAPVAAHLRGVPAVAHALSPRTSVDAFGGSGTQRVERLWADHGVDVAPVDVFTGDAFLDIIPADQFLNADLLRTADLATVLEPAAATPSAVAAAAADAMRRYRPGVDAVRREIAAMPAPTVVLEQLIARFDPHADAAA